MALQDTDILAAQRGTTAYKVPASEIKTYTATPQATEAIAGKVELATAAETTTGTDSTRAVHPAGLKVELDKKVNKAGDTMTGNLTVPSLNGGQLAGFRNVIINGDLKINQRNLTHGAVADGAYFADRWKRVDASDMTQVIESTNYEPNATYTLSGTGITTQQLTSPASGHWTLPSIPATATKIQLELGPVATPFERRPFGLELLLCQYYYQIQACYGRSYAAILATVRCDKVQLAPRMRTAPTVTVVGSTYINASNLQTDTITARYVGLLHTHTAVNVNASSSGDIRCDAEL